MILRTPLLALVLSSFAFVACNGATTSDVEARPDPDAISSSLEQEAGGLDETDEAPAFGDPKISSVDGLDPVDPELGDVPEVAGVRRFRVALIWGHLPSPSDGSTADPDPQPVDWTGSVAVDGGAIGVLRKLKFDRRDELLRRADRAEVSFRSRTLPHVDGLYLRVAVAPGAAPVLHYRTAALTTDIDLSKLGEDGMGTQRLGDGRNGLAWIGFPEVAGCTRGLAFGRWIKVRPALGTLRGRVFDDSGETIGHVRGIWGHAPRRDQDLFFGKYVSVEGKHRGLFGGTYGDGEGRGVWKTRDGIGGFELAYSDGYEKDDGRGVWIGRWSERCGPAGER